MPEPAEDKDQSSPWSLDRAQPFECQEEWKAPLKNKFFFLLFPVGLLYWTQLQGNEADLESTFDFRDRNNMLWYAFFVRVQWKWAVYNNYCNLSWMGTCPQAYASRYFVMYYFSSTCLNMSVQAGCAGVIADRQNEFHFLDDITWTSDCYWNATWLPLLFVYGMSVWRRNQFAVRSGYGVYCCASFQTARMWRVAFLLTIMVGIIDYYVSQMLANPKLIDLGAAMPFCVFGWKRMKYVIGLVICMDDGPCKDRSIFSQCWFFMLLFNHALSISMIGANSWADVVTFISCDWFQFGMRMVLLLRLGMKTCPKLISLLITKQLENISSPMPAAANGLGDRTAMRTMQAFMCIIEGESLSINFIFALLFFTHTYLILGYNAMLFVVPMRHVGILLMFCALDTIQDIIAGVGSHKFSNFSYMTVIGGNAWHSKKMFPFFTHLYVSWLAAVNAQGGFMVNKKNLSSHGNFGSPFTLQYAKGEFSSLHI